MEWIISQGDICLFIPPLSFSPSLSPSFFSSRQTAKQHSGLLESARGFCMSLVFGTESSGTRIWPLPKDNICQSSPVLDLCCLIHSAASTRLNAGLHIPPGDLKLKKSPFRVFNHSKKCFSKGTDSLSVFNRRVQLCWGVRNQKKGQKI